MRRARRLRGAAGVVAVVAGTLLLIAPAQATTIGSTGSGAGQFCGPAGAAVEQASGGFYVADFCNHRIEKFEANGTFLFAFGWGVQNGAKELQTCTIATTCRRGIFPIGAVAGEFNGPSAVAVEQSTGDVYVAGDFNRVQKFDSEGHFLLAFGGDVVAHGPDNSAVNERQKLTVAAEGGTFKLSFEYPYAKAYEEGTVIGETAALPYNATAAQLETALDALSTIGGLGGSVAVTGGPGDATGSSPYEITFEGNLGGDDVPTLQTESSLTGTTHTVAVATVNQGGGPEVCKAAGVCKEGDTGTANGQFSPPPAGDDSGLIATGAGTVYVADQGRVQEFAASGAYTGQISPPGAGGVLALAVNSKGDVYLTAAGLSGVHEYEPSGTEIGSPLDASGKPGALALNAADELYVRDFAGATTQILGYDSAGNQTALIRTAEIEQPNGGFALGETAKLLYAPDSLSGSSQTPGYDHVVIVPLPPPGPAIEPGSEHATEILSTAATLDAAVNPQSKSTTFHFEYVDDAHFKSEGGFASSHTQSTTPESAPIGSNFESHPVSEAISGLAPETTYHFRVVAHNSAGTVPGPGATFATKPPVTFAVQPPAALTTTSAALRVYLNPLGHDTTYRFQYGETEAYGSLTPEAGAGEGTAFVPEEAPIAGLQPNTTYHFRALAHNSAGAATGPDLAFTTEPASCPNQALRTEDNSTALPECRAYEQLSPVDKGGSSAAAGELASSGERVHFLSLGTFDGQANDGHDYLAHRTAAGWITEGIDPPPSLGFGTGSLPAANPELTEFATDMLVPGFTQADHGSATSGALFLRRPDGSFLQASPTFGPTDGGSTIETSGSPLQLGGRASADLSTVVIDSSAPLLPADPIPTEAFNQRPYEIAGFGTASPVLRLLGLDNAGNPLPVCHEQNLSTQAQRFGLGGVSYIEDNGGPTKDEHTVSSDGSRIFFTIRSSALPGGCTLRAGGYGESWQLLARENGQTTVDLSAPQPNDECITTACLASTPSAANFQDASADGSKVFFQSAQQLTDNASEDADPHDGIEKNTDHCATFPRGSGCNLYMYDFNRPAGHNLLDISAGDTSGLGPRVHGTLGISRDGSHVYFVAGGVLTEEPGPEGMTAQAGADNLYVADTEDGKVSFIADLCRGPERSGTLTGVSQCPAGLDEGGSSYPVDLANLVTPQVPHKFDITPDGRYLVFSAYARLTPDDTNQAQDVYRYDAVTGSLLRVSTGHEGEDENGNGGGQNAVVNTYAEGSKGGPGFHAISDDGQTIAFQTARPLQSSAESGHVVAYEWHQGQVNLISGGRSPRDNFRVTVSPSGRDIVFDTVQGLLPTDTDGLEDVYDARAGGGFPLPPPEVPICEGAERCHGEGTHEPPQPTLGTGTFVGPPNPTEKPCKKGSVRKHGKCVKKHHKPKKHHKGKHKRAGNNRGGAR